VGKFFLGKFKLQQDIVCMMLSRQTLFISVCYLICCLICKPILGIGATFELQLNGSANLLIGQKVDTSAFGAILSEQKLDGEWEWERGGPTALSLIH